MRYDNDWRGFPAERGAWESVIAAPCWRDRTLHTIELHPVSVGFGIPRGVRGTSRLATAEDGQETIADMQRLSEPFGTNVTYRDGVGMTALG